MSKRKTDHRAIRRRAVIAASLPEIESAIQGLDDLTPQRFMFVDPRPSGSLKLTAEGYALIQDKYSHWSQKLPDRMSMGDFGYLIAVSTFPYFIHDGLFTTFDPNVGCMIKLAGGDFEKMRRLLPPA